MLKLTEREDDEPYVCQQLSERCSAAQPDLKICPTIYKIGPCQVQDQWGSSFPHFFAWLAEYATPLDKYMQGLNVDRRACLKMALYKQVLASQHGLLMSDNNLFNFGVLDNTVVIIDTGSRTVKSHAITKGMMWWHILASCKSLLEQLVHIQAGFCRRRTRCLERRSKRQKTRKSSANGQRCCMTEPYSCAETPLEKGVLQNLHPDELSSSAV